jgi:hypothetical protein
MKFQTDYKYTDRKTKSKYVYEKYKSILKNSILDIGADNCYLKENLPDNVTYTGIGLGDHPDLLKIDLEKEAIFLDNDSYYCVLCLDVLEHLDNIHDVFAECCRITSRYLILSFPNPWADLMNSLRFNKYRDNKNLKFYGLPVKPEEDRHKWFFPFSELKTFVEINAQKNAMKIIDVQVNNEHFHKNIKNFYHIALMKLLFRKDIELSDLYYGTSWWVLEKHND